MSIFASGDVPSVVLFGTLLLSVIGLIGFVVVKLGGPPKSLTYRGLQIRLHAGLPTGKIVLVDGNWRPIGETAPDLFDTTPLPQGSAAAWLSSRDFAQLEARKTILPQILSRPLQPDVGVGR